MQPTLRARWTALSPLARDVTIVLVVKAIVLFLLWFAFFRAPAAPGMAMAPERVQQHLLSSSPGPESPHAVP
jgi:hypothetical protein